MKIGIYLSDFKADEGGAHTFERDLLNHLIQGNAAHELLVFHSGKKTGTLPSKKGSVPLISVYSNPFLLFRLFRALKRFLLKTAAILKQKSYTETSTLDKAAAIHKINLILFLGPYFDDTRMPFIFPHWDLAHRITPFFPEVNYQGLSWAKREHFFRNTMPKAVCILTGTQAGKNEIREFYQIREDRIRVLGLPVPSFARKSTPDQKALCEKYGIRPGFLFYPAQFWPHKNHIRLLLALKLLNEKHGINIHLVLTGSDKGNLPFIRKQMTALGLENRVHLLGFVPAKDMNGLYKAAFALVFPTFFGPDNLPPLEAFANGCPVLASRMAGAEEQFGDAALLFDPVKETEIADAVARLAKDESLRKNLIEKGLLRAEKWGMNSYAEAMLAAAAEFEPYACCWEPG